MPSHEARDLDEAPGPSYGRYKFKSTAVPVTSDSLSWILLFGFNTLIAEFQCLRGSRDLMAARGHAITWVDSKFLIPAQMRRGHLYGPPRNKGSIMRCRSDRRNVSFKFFRVHLVRLAGLFGNLRLGNQPPVTKILCGTTNCFPTHQGASPIPP